MQDTGKIEYHMKKIIITLIYFLLSTILVAQSVGINNNSPHASAILDVQSTTKGFLMPRMTTLQRTAIASPAAGLKVFDTDTKTFWFYNGSVWLSITAGTTGWSLTGNAAINPTTHFIGTTDEQPLRFRVNNLWAGELHPTSGNVFLGVGAGQANTNGHSNTANGAYALTSNTVGFQNTAIGRNALFANITGRFNTANGADALFTNSTGNSNTSIGYQALYANSTGGNNTASGKSALYSNTTGIDNTANGFQALYSNTTGNSNTAIGADALVNNTIGFNNTASGGNALYSNSTGSNNVANGFQALNNNTIGNYNTANGVQALAVNLSGFENTANGFQALYTNTIGNYNTAVGVKALYNNTEGSQNTANGNGALFSNTIGNYNTTNGANALFNNTEGNQNTATGNGALISNTIGNNNTAIGNGALYNNTNGDNNTAIGVAALYNNIIGSRNIAIGSLSGTAASTPNLSNTISIGNDGSFLNAASNQAIIGNSSTVFIGGKVNWGIVSDERIKRNIKEEVKGLDFILKLRPVTYNISNVAISEVRKITDTVNFTGKYDGEKITYTGFLAQEVERAAIAAGYNFSGYTKPVTTDQLYTIRYAEFVVPLTKAVQEQQGIITIQQKQIDLLEKRLAALEAKK